MFMLATSLREDGPRTPSAAHQAYQRRLRRGRLGVTVTQWLLLLTVIGLWEGFAHWGLIDPFLTSQPSRVVATLVQLSQTGQLWVHLGATVWETVVGFVLGSLLGIFGAVLFWWSPWLNRVLDPYLMVLNATPKTALGPLFIIWFGIGFKAIVAMALAISLVVTLITVYTGFAQVDPLQIKLARTFRASQLQILLKVVLPASLPTLVAALKSNIGLTWVGVIVGEFLVARVGLGYLISYGGQVFQLDLIMASVVLLLVLAAFLYYGISAAERWFLRWRG